LAGDASLATVKRPHVSNDLSILLGRIRLLLDAREHESVAGQDDFELTLTDGYAHALALEGERRRTDERIRELAGIPEHDAEVAALKDRRDLVEEQHERLRGLLGALASNR
jgi:hypothetical protein